MIHKLALDTNVLIALCHRDNSVRECVWRYLNPHTLIVIPFVAYYETLYGLVTGNVEKNKIRLNYFSKLHQYTEILWPNEITLTIFKNLGGQLARSGTPIGSNDTMIAASCLQNASHLLTSDSDFLQVPQLQVIQFTGN